MIFYRIVFNHIDTRQAVDENDLPVALELIDNFKRNQLESVGIKTPAGHVFTSGTVAAFYHQDIQPGSRHAHLIGS